MENVVKMVYKGVFDIPVGEDLSVIILTDKDEKRSLALPTNHKMSKELKDHVDQTVETKMRTEDVLARFVKERIGVEYSYIFFDLKKDVGVIAYLEDRIKGIQIPISPDHAVLLSMVTGIDLCIDDDIFPYLTTPYKPDVQMVSLPINGLPDSILKKALEQVIKEENYEVASYIRDEIRHREKSRHHSDNNNSDKG